jgi:hypothetical protein
LPVMMKMMIGLFHIGELGANFKITYMEKVESKFSLKNACYLSVQNLFVFALYLPVVCMGIVTWRRD